MQGTVHVRGWQTNTVATIISSNGTAVRVVLLSDNRHFKIFADDKEMGSFYLPAYSDNGSRAAVIALTPATATVDVALAAIVVAAVAAAIYYSSNSQSH